MCLTKGQGGACDSSSEADVVRQDSLCVALPAIRRPFLRPERLIAYPFGS